MTRLCTVRPHKRTLKPAYDPQTHYELRLNINMEAWFEIDMLNVPAEVMADLASKRLAFLATLETV